MVFFGSYVPRLGLGLRTGLGMAARDGWLDLCREGSWTEMLAGRKLIQFTIEGHWFVLSVWSTPITGVDLRKIFLRSMISGT